MKTSDLTHVCISFAPYTAAPTGADGEKTPETDSAATNGGVHSNGGLITYSGSLNEELNKPQAIPRTTSTQQTSSGLQTTSSSLNKISPICSHLTGAVATPLASLVSGGAVPSLPRSNTTTYPTNNASHMQQQAPRSESTLDSASQNTLPSQTANNNANNNTQPNYSSAASKYQFSATKQDSTESAPPFHSSNINEPSLMSQLAAELNFNFAQIDAKNR